MPPAESKVRHIKRQKLMQGWLSCWLYVISMISGIVIGALLINWRVWTLQTRLFAIATALLPIHVLEEWRFPGGFHTMYNLMAGSELTDRYPMNQLSDMWTNLIGVIFGCTVLLIGVTPLFCVMQLLLCFAELYGHISGGVFSKKRFEAKGKRTIYNPGLFTTLLGYLPIAVGIVLSFFTERPPTVLECVLAFAFGAALGVFSLKLVEKLCKSEETPYAYTWGSGYFERYR